jgi:hypothetical protein
MKVGFKNPVPILFALIPALSSMSSVLSFLGRTFGKGSAQTSARVAMNSSDVFNIKTTETATFAMG